MDPVFAVSLAGTIEKIGAYAGFAAIPGLAVLALLYFGQAREVRRLREWAGRAPERAQELQERVAEQASHAASGRRVTGQPRPGRPGTAAARAAGSAPPATGRGQPPRASPATTGAQAVQPGQPRQPPGSPPPGPGASAAAPPPAPDAGDRAVAQRAPAGATVAGAGRSVDEVSTARSSEPGPGGSAAAPPEADAGGAADDHRDESSHAAGVRAAARPGATAAPLRTTRRTTTLPRTPTNDATYTVRRAADEPSGLDRGGRRGGRRRALAVAAGIAVVAAVGLAVVVISDTGGGGAQPAGKGASAGVPSAAAPPGGPVVRGRTTVAVLNGTTVPGLASKVANELERGGFRRGSVTNAADQQRASTTVDYAPGYQRAAREVGSILKVRQVVPIDAGTQAIAGPQAGVVVTVGTDRMR
ncbi:MAG: LytR C-terminal domain-containing protein [Solirubrobacteraceae bacterium]